MARSTSKFTSKSGAGVLRPLADDALAPQVSRIEGRRLTPVPFRAQAGQPPESDGRGLSRFGVRFREVFAAEHGISPAEVPLGIVRQMEALNADDDHNMAALTAIQEKRTEHGVLRQIRLRVNTPLLFPWLLNGRALRRMGREMRGGAPVLTTAEDHPLLALPTMRVGGPEAVLETVAAQRQLLNLSNYTAAEPKKKDRIDSIVQFGVLEAPDVIPTQLISDDGTAWVVQAAEGAQRLFSALVGMDTIANRNVASVATDQWFRSREPRLRDLSAEDLDKLPVALRYSATAAAGAFPGPDVETWLRTVATADPAVVAFQLMRVMDVNLIVAVRPDPAVASTMPNPVVDTVQEMIRGYHMPGKSKEQWNERDVFGLVAIGAIDDLHSTKWVSHAERSQWLGEAVAPWSGPLTDTAGDPGNRLQSVTRLMAILTAQNALEDRVVTTIGTSTIYLPGDSLDVVNHNLKLNNVRVHSDDRAKVAAAQAIAALDMHSSGWEGTLQAALYGTFRHSWFWKTSDHSGRVPWPRLLSMPIDELADLARAERAAQADPSDEDGAGPAQRALAALGGIALMANPGLIEARDALSRTGMGAGGQRTQVSATDPAHLLKRMVQFDDGINQLTDAVVALTVLAEPTIPLDREDQTALTDLYLRKRWLGDARTTPDNPSSEFARRVLELVTRLKTDRDESDALRAIFPGQLVGLTGPDPDDPDYAPDLWADPVYEEIGIGEDVVDDILPVLQVLVDFFQVGKAYARAAARAAR